MTIGLVILCVVCSSIVAFLFGFAAGDSLAHQRAAFREQERQRQLREREALGRAEPYRPPFFTAGNPWGQN